MRAYFSTELAPCPYLEGRLERRLVAGLAGRHADRRHDQLVRAGFRRSQRYAYRPACPGCQACVSVRIPVERFAFTRTWRKIQRLNADLVPTETPPLPTDEQFALFRRYLAGRHGDGGMVDMSFADYQAMVADTPVSTRILQWRRGEDGPLYAVSLTDRTSSGLSGVYKFFEPDEPKRSLGSQIILWHIEQARREKLPHVYLGYWIAGCRKMAYKARFQPLEMLTPNGWLPFTPLEADQGTARALLTTT